MQLFTEKGDMPAFLKMAAPPNTQYTRGHMQDRLRAPSVHRINPCSHGKWAEGKSSLAEDLLVKAVTVSIH